MLRSVLVDYVESLTERQFDTPLMCILLKQGYFDIHFIHGAFEFGKDFLAKKIEGEQVIQYIFQSKAGNINTHEWNTIRGQIEEARINPISHPSFDSSLEKEVVLITTGRLVGAASASTQQYKEYCIQQYNTRFNVWDNQTLIEMVTDSELYGLGLVKEDAAFLELLSALKLNKSNMKEILEYSEKWLSQCSGGHRRNTLSVIFESSLFTHELLTKNRVTLAAYVSLMPIRAMVYSYHESGELSPWANDCIKLSTAAFEKICLLLETGISDCSETKEGLFKYSSNEIHSFISHPIICLQVIELLGLYGLMLAKNEEEDHAQQVAKIVNGLISNNNACSSPISDRYAMSLIPPTILLYKFGYKDTVEIFLKRVAIWLCDRYDSSDSGLASPYASEQEEIEILLGYAFDFNQIPKRNESYIATILLDLAGIFQFETIYEEIFNDIQAVSIHPISVETNNTLGQYTNLDTDATFVPVVKFKENLMPFWRIVDTESSSFALENNLWWETLAIYSLLRDRHNPKHISHIFNILE